MKIKINVHQSNNLLSSKWLTLNLHNPSVANALCLHGPACKVISIKSAKDRDFQSSTVTSLVDVVLQPLQNVIRLYQKTKKTPYTQTVGTNQE